MFFSLMKIGVDLDEVVVEQLPTLIEFYRAKTGQHVPYEMFHSYLWPEVWGITHAEAYALDVEFKNSDAFANLPAISGAIDGLSHLVDVKGHDATYITARPHVFYEKTRRWIDRHLSHVRGELTHCHDPSKPEWGGKKYNVCKEYGISVLVEDDGRHAIPCAERGITVLMPERPWNRNVRGENIIPVSSWTEIVDYISSLKK